MKNFLIFIALAITIQAPRARADEDIKKFLRTCTYGVVAGALVGAASLAFAEDPGSNLNPIARGASFGLYGGIIVGLINMNSASESEVPTVLILPKRDGLETQVTVLQF